MNQHAHRPPLRVTVWNENVHETTEEHVAKRYPHGIHGTIADGLGRLLGDGARIRTATLEQPEHGLSEEVLAETDVLTWWGHIAHDKVEDEIVERVHRHVLAGMGLLVLHSGHFAKVFKKLMGTTCSLRWDNQPSREVVWTVDPTHPIARGVPSPLILPEQEMYSEFFDIPAPDELVFISSFTGGEVFRSGCTFRRGHGKIFYFSPGDQDFPVYHDEGVQRVLANGVRWAAPERERGIPEVAHAPRGWYENAGSQD